GFVAAAGTLGILAVVGLGVWVHLESTLFGLMSRHRGRWTAIGGLGFHAIHHLTVPAACLLGVVLGRWATEIDEPGGRRRRLAWLLSAWAPTILVGPVAVVAILLGPSVIHGWLSDMEAGVRGVPTDRFAPRYDETAVAGILARLPVLLLPLILFGGWVSWSGPLRMRRAVQDAA
ncbi:MAG: hypothetical protein GY895_15285, partial [Phycisphaera sp.]|nr:hypothetical protein [Phycisphaera sp.]